MVKNFKGELLEKPKHKDLPPVLVADFMETTLVTFRPQQSIYEVVHTLLSKKISGGPVVNDQNQLVGVISEGDCLKEVVRGKYHDMPVLSGKVEDHMTREVVSISPSETIFDVARIFLQRRLRRFPVVVDGKLVGMLSQKDIMKAVLNMKD